MARAQFDLDRLAGPAEELEAGRLIGEIGPELLPDHVVDGGAGERGEAVVDGDDHVVVADDQPFDRRVGEAAHAVGLELRAPPIPDIEREAGEGQHDDGEACERDCDREPARRQRRFRHFDGRVGDDRHRAHGGEMVAADGERQQHRAIDARFRRLVPEPGPQGGAAQRSAERDRSCDQQRVPHDPPLDLEGRHAGIVQDSDAAADDHAADPGAARQRLRQGDGKAETGQNDGGDERQNGEGDVVAARQAGRERQHGDEVGRPDAEPGGDGGDREPDIADLAGRLADVMEQRDRRDRCEQAYDGREADEPEVMRVDDAAVDLEHVGPIPCRTPWGDAAQASLPGNLKR